MEGFFSLLIGWFVYIIRIGKQNKIDNDFLINNINKSKAEKKFYYYDNNCNKRLLNNNRIIYSQLNEERDLCYYDKGTNQLIYNDTKAKRIQNKINKIKEAQRNGTKYFTLPYVYRTKDGKDNDWCTSEVVETSTLQPFQLGYIPIPNYGFVMRKAPAINPNELYDYSYRYDESKWREWHIISKEKYIEMSNKPIYECEVLYNYDLSKIIKD